MTEPGHSPARRLRHELVTPINHLLSYAQLVRDDAADHGWQAALSEIDTLLTRGREAVALVDDLLASRIADDSLSLKHTQLELQLHRIAAAVSSVRGTLADRITGQTENDLQRVDDALSELRRRLGDVFALDPAEPVEPAEAVDPLPATGEATLPATRGIVLVVDDTEPNRDALSRSLRRLGYAVRQAANGRDALRILTEQDVDLVLLDILMPEMDGYQVLERRRHDRRLRDIPFIMISALDELDSVVRCIEMGAEDYLPKPFNPVLLRARIGACIETRRLRQEGQRLRREVHSLRVEIDAARTARQVAAITETDYFQALEAKLEALRAGFADP